MADDEPFLVEMWDGTKLDLVTLALKWITSHAPDEVVQISDLAALIVDLQCMSYEAAKAAAVRAVRLGVLVPIYRAQGGQWTEKLSQLSAFKPDEIEVAFKRTATVPSLSRRPRNA